MSAYGQKRSFNNSQREPQARRVPPCSARTVIGCIVVLTPWLDNSNQSNNVIHTTIVLAH